MEVKEILGNKKVQICCIVLCVLVYLTMLFSYFTVSSHLKGPDSFLAKHTIIYGSDDLSPKLVKHGIAFTTKVDETNRKDIAPGDIVIYTSYVNGDPVKVCMKVSAVKNGFVETAEGIAGTMQGVRITEITAKVSLPINVAAFAVSLMLIPAGRIGFLVLSGLLPVAAVAAGIYIARKRNNPVFLQP